MRRYKQDFPVEVPVRVRSENGEEVATVMRGRFSRWGEGTLHGRAIGKSRNENSAGMLAIHVGNSSVYSQR